MVFAGKKTGIAPPSAWVAGFLLLLVAAGAEEQKLAVDLSEGLENGILARDPGAEDGRCVVADVSKMAGTAFDTATPKLQPGVYRAVLKLKLPLINNLNTGPLSWNFEVKGAGKGLREFDILLVERAGVYQEIPCPFVVDRPGQASVALSWKRVALKPETRADMRVETKDIPTVTDVASAKDEPEAQSESEIEAELSEEPPIAGLKYLWMAVDSVVVVPVSDVGVTQLEVDKVRYKPGEKAAVQVGVRNYSAKPRTLKVRTFFVHDLDTVIPVDERTVSLEAGAASDFACQGPPFEKRWGYAVQCQVFEDDRQVAEKSDCFTVHENMWAVLIAGRGPAQFTAHVTPERAMQAAKANKKRYWNFVESGFWPPDGFGDFTPDQDRWWSGQGCYYGSVAGTRLQADEGHKVGISFAMYSNIWGGDGPPAFEMIRRQPDWGYAAAFNVEWFDRWDRNPMGTGRDGFPLHVWPVTIINHGGSDAPIRYHARELIETHKMCGWDAVRYDSHGIDDWSARLVKTVKDTVRKEVPDFQFGYNSSVPHRDPSKVEAFKVHCEGGGGIMEEGIRQFGGGGLSFSGGATYEAFAKRILEFKKEAREFGGHFVAIGMDKCFPNDLVYQYIFWFAGNTHPCYNWLEVCVADYTQFVTRFAGQMWDLEVVPVTSPEKWLDVGKAAEFLWLWKEYVHQRDLGGGRRQLIVHLINSPEEKVLYTHDDAKVPAPRESIPVTLKLPDGAKVRAVWFLTPEYELTQCRLSHEATGQGTISFSVPRIRFWSTVVVELDSAKAFE
jgi:hypothetical protein